MPGLDGYQRFTERSGYNAPARWDPKQSDNHWTKAYLLSHPQKKLWTTVRRLYVPNQVDPNTTLTRYKDHISAYLQGRGFQNSGSKTVNWASGEAFIQKIDKFAPGYHCQAICLVPKGPRTGREVFLVTVVYTDASKAEGQKLVDHILKKAEYR